MNKFINLHPHEVPSVLSGRQTQFCRVVRPQPYEFEGNYYFSHGKAKGLGLSYAEIACSIGQPGDILVGREAFVSVYPARVAMFSIVMRVVTTSQNILGTWQVLKMRVGLATRGLLSADGQTTMECLLRISRGNHQPKCPPGPAESTDQ